MSVVITSVPLTVVDGNNYFRRRIEAIVMGSPLRSCFEELQNKTGVVMVVWDGAGGLKPRREIYPDYKMSRKPAGESIYESQNLFKRLLEFSKVFQFQVQGYEGDDVIAHLVNRFNPSFRDIIVESNDLDLYQLGKAMSRDRFPDKPHNIRLYKTMVGDPSDNIPGCKAFGKGAWESLNEEQKRILESIVAEGDQLSDGDVEARVASFFPKRSLSWFCNQENRKLLQTFYRIVGFIDVPSELVDQANKPGNNRPDLAEPIFKEFMI